MSDMEIFIKYMLLFPKFSERTFRYTSQGSDSIHIWQNDGKEYVFTYISSDDWLLETHNFYKHRVGGEITNDCIHGSN